MLALRLQGLALTLVLAIGCGKKKEDAAGGTTSGAKDGGDVVTAPDASAPVADAAEAATPDAAAAAPASGLSGRADGVGPLDEKFAVTKKSLEEAFPGFTVAKVTKRYSGDLMEEYWNVQKDGKDVLHVQAEDEDIDAVDIMSDDVANPLGVKIGATYADVEKALGKLSCQNAGDEIDWRSDVVICTSDKADTYTIDFVSLDGEEAVEMLGDPARLAKATVRAVTWRVPLPGPG
jgi:hypothetical protein